jgi:hypothetical protein
MSTRSENLARRVQQANDDLLRAVESTTEEKWNAKCADGEWSRGFAAFHAATSIGFGTGILQGIAEGQPFTPTTRAAIDEGNAAMNKQHGSTCQKAETIDLINSSAPGAAQMVRSLSDAQLDRKVTLLEGMPEFTVEQVIEMLFVGHPNRHRESITNAR